MAFGVLIVAQWFFVVALDQCNVNGQTSKPKPIDPALLIARNSGKSVTLKTIAELKSRLNNGIFPDDHKILERTALVESKFGTDPRTFRSGYHGGIMQVDYIGFLDTQDVKSHGNLPKAHREISKKFGIDWAKVTWKDLEKPLFSVLAARLHYLNSPTKIPNTLLGQAKLWKNRYNTVQGAGTATKFVKDVLTHGSGVSSADFAGIGNAQRGKKIFVQKGAQCHSTSWNHKQGPNLVGIVGRKAGTAPGYSSTDALKNSGITWDASTLYQFLKNPKRFIPGTKMVFAGLMKHQDLLDLVAYLCTI